jgi:hypothetical protein
VSAVGRIGRWLVGSTPGRIVLALVVVAGVAATAVLVLGGDDAEAPTATTTTSHPVDTDPEEPPSGLRFFPDDDAAEGTAAPLTGLRVADGALLERPAVAVKVDNLDVPGESARPQVGLARADVVVEEVVEGGITRFVALFHSTTSEDAGPVRSARTTDVHLLPAFGAPLFAYSGGNPGVLAAVRAAPSVIDVGGEWAPAYHRVDDRVAPHNLMVRPDEIWAAADGRGEPPPSLGAFQPLDADLPDGESVAGVDLAYEGMGASPASWRWSVPDERWVRTQRDELHVDAEGYVIGPRNVVVLVTEYRPSSADARSPEAVTVGSGEALVLTRGVLVRGRWERETESDGFRLTDGDGEEIPLTVGRTWIELAPAGTARVSA